MRRDGLDLPIRADTSFEDPGYVEGIVGDVIHIRSDIASKEEWLRVVRKGYGIGNDSAIFLPTRCIPIISVIVRNYSLRIVQLSNPIWRS